MRSIGVFRGSAQTLASDTAAHDHFSEMERRMARQNVKANSKPKVGVLSSSQVTQMRANAPTTKTLGKTNFGGAQTTVVRNALNRVRNASCVAPKKKGVAPVCQPNRPVQECPQIKVLQLSDVAVDQKDGTWLLKPNAEIKACESLTISEIVYVNNETLNFNTLTNNGYLYLNDFKSELRFYFGGILQNNHKMYVYGGAKVDGYGGGDIINQGTISIGLEFSPCGEGTIAETVTVSGPGGVNNHCP